MDENNYRREGVVKLYQLEKGYGFIQGKSNEGDIFFHAQNVADGIVLERGDRVFFTLFSAKKGFAAVDVGLVSKNNFDNQGKKNDFI